MYKSNAFASVWEMYKTKETELLSKEEELATHKEELEVMKVRFESLQEKCRELEQQLQEKTEILLNVSDAADNAVEELTQLGTDLTERHIFDQPANILTQTAEKIRKTIVNHLLLIFTNPSE
jgi:hypothetical protein